MVKVDEFVAHATRESFMAATGAARQGHQYGGLGQTPPVPELTERGERQMRESLRAAYGVTPHVAPAPDLRPEGQARAARNREYVLATDAEIRAASRLARAAGATQ